MAKNALIEAVRGSKKRNFQSKMYEIVLHVLPAEAGTTFLKKCGAKSELDHKNHERGILKLAFLMQLRIKIQR